MESQYAHWQRTRGIIEWRVRIPFNPSLTFEDYAQLPQLQNYQTQALGGKSLDSFAVVGVTEELDPFTKKLLDCLREAGFVSSHDESSFKVKWLNRTPRLGRPFSYYDSDFLKRFQEFHEEDYLLYESAKRLVKS